MAAIKLVDAFPRNMRPVTVARRGIPPPVEKLVGHVEDIIFAFPSRLHGTEGQVSEVPDVSFSVDKNVGGERSHPIRSLIIQVPGLRVLSD